MSWEQSMLSELQNLNDKISEQNKMLSRQNAILADRNNISNAHTPWQKCPKCDGQGIVAKPPGMAAEVQQWSSTSLAHACDVCNGAKIIPMHCVKKE